MDYWTDLFFAQKIFFKKLTVKLYSVRNGYIYLAARTHLEKDDVMLWAVSSEVLAKRRSLGWIIE